MARFISFLLITILIFTFSAKAQQKIIIEYSQEAHSNSGPLFPLYHSFFHFIEPGPDKARVFNTRNLRLGLPLSENVDILWMQNHRHDFLSTKSTLSFIQQQLKGGNSYFSEDFFLHREKISTGGPGFSWKPGFSNLIFESSLVLLLKNQLTTDLFIGEIEGNSATGRYERLQSPDSCNSLGLTTHINFSYKRDSEVFGLYINNLLGFVYFPEIIYRSGQFRYQDYDYDEDGYLIVPPIMRGIRRYRPYHHLLSPEGGLYFSSPEGEMNIRLTDPQSFKLKIFLGNSFSLISNFPNFALGVKYQSEKGSWYLLVDDIRPNKIAVLGLGGAIWFSF